MRLNRTLGLPILLSLILAAAGTARAEDSLRFSGYQWRLDDPQAHLAERNGVETLVMKSGSLWLEDETLETGTLQVDVTAPGGPGFAGIGFHAQDSENLELVYARLHRSGQWDAVQYCPRFNAIDGWQLYSGEPFTGKAGWQPQTPFRLRLEVGKRTVRVFVGEEAAEPVAIAPLQRSGGGSGIMLWSRIGSELSNFRMSRGAVAEPAEALGPRRTEEGWQPIRSWSISPGLDAAALPARPRSVADLPAALEALA